jgi:very-short-patch-repair endonuclease
MSRVISKGAATLALHLRAEGIPFKEEFPFYPSRKWRADFKIDPDILVEVDGGNRMAAMVNGRPVAVGRHTGDADYEKLNAAALKGYRVLRFSPAQVQSGYAIDLIKKILAYFAPA